MTSLQGFREFSIALQRVKTVHLKTCDQKKKLQQISCVAALKYHSLYKQITNFPIFFTAHPGQDDQHILVLIISIGVLGMLLIVVFILLIIQKVSSDLSA